ncbi:MAG: hypothetical protein KME19_21495 [Microcoleus vaginatus WJT46-NPBG5]|jgi:hypothetical protein|nr:hypothetical protein [Microcoleus vaginatus WJT46-NPBG5]
MSSQEPPIFQISFSAKINLDKDHKKNKANRLIDDKAYQDKANYLLKILLEIEAVRFDESNDRLVIANFYANNEKSVWPLPMLGYVAEAIVVHECHSNATKNERWSKCARKIKHNIPTDFSNSNVYKNNNSLFETPIIYEPLSSASLKDYIAIGTGLPTTKTNYPGIYNHRSDRDICWVNKRYNDVKQLSDIEARERAEQNFASIQLKVSCGKRGDYVTNYFKEKPCNRLYPVVYFDLGNDFDQVRRNLININSEKEDTLFYNNNENYSRVELVDMMLIRGKSIDPDLHEELLFYKHLLNQIFRGKYSFYELKDENILMSLISEYVNHNS